MDPAPPAPPRRDLDYTTLTQRVGLRPRLRAAAGNNVLVIGLTVSVLVAVVPAIILVALVATGNATDGGAIAFLVLFMLGGVYAVVDGLGQAGGASALTRFAEVNDLESFSGTTATHYAAAVFADGTHLVAQGVRTRDQLLVEVGDRFPTTSPSEGSINAAELYLRFRLPAWVRGPLDTAALVGDLAEALTRFAGEWTIDVSYDEVTVLGSRPLQAAEPGRVEEAFALADALAARGVSLAGPAPVRSRRRAGPADAATVSGIPVPEVPRAAEAAGRPRSAARVVALTLAMLVVVPLGFAAVMSQVDDGLRGNELGAVVVVSLFVALVFAIVRWLIRSSVSPRRRGRARH